MADINSRADTSQVCDPYTTAGADIDLVKVINMQRCLPRAIYFNTTGSYVLTFEVDNADTTKTIPVQAGVLLPIAPHTCESTTASSLDFTAIY